MDQPQLIPLGLEHATRNQLWLLATASETWLIKAYLGRGAHRRRDNESAALRLWAAHGYAVPRLHGNLHAPIDCPHLAMSYLRGPSLHRYLADRAIPFSQRLEILSSLLHDTARRHRQALETNDLRLIRGDSNTGNFLVTSSGIYHIDLEHPPDTRALPEAAAIELARLLRWSARDLGPEHLQAILSLAVQAYAGQTDLLAHIIDRTTRRPAQFLHRWLDQRRRARSGQTITKYDIADGLALTLANSTVDK